MRANKILHDKQRPCLIISHVHIAQRLAGSAARLSSLQRMHFQSLQESTGGRKSSPEVTPTILAQRIRQTTNKMS